MSIKRTARLLSAILALAALHTAAADAQSLDIVRERIRPSFPMLSLGERQTSGQAAIDRLGARLPEIASWYGKSADALRQQLLSDRRVRLDEKGRMFVVEEIETPIAPSSASQDSLLQGQLMPLEQTFLLHSRPGAKRTIYLDFNGAVLSNTAWNGSGGTITAKPYDIDGVPTAFSETELQRIQYIWQRVAEDYAPFDVDVTTETPAPDRLTRSDANDQVFGTTVLITDNTGVYNCSCGGVAYVGVFNDTSDRYKPALVFYNRLGNGNEKAVAEAASHEAGHNLGLSHDGTSSVAYYGGQGSDPATGWAPIMGVGYYKPVVQFSKGEYAYANNKEDDFAVAQSFGLPLRADDYGSTLDTAAALPDSGTIDGVIERAADKDVFTFAAAAGSFTATVDPANRSANADLVLSLLDSAGAVLATSNPQNALNAALSYQITRPGTYYIRVESTGLGNPAGEGYSSYGSVGNYRVAASFTAGGTPPKPVLSVSATTGIAPVAVTLDASQSTDADGSVKFYYWDFGDGTRDSTGSLQNVTKTYSATGNYTVRLTVVDDAGFSASTTRVISVGAAIPAKAVTVQSVSMKLSVSRRGTARVKTTVVVVNQDGQLMRSAVVYGDWTGAVTKSVAKRTSRRGTAGFSSPSTLNTGCFNFKITNIVLAGYSVDPAALRTSQVCR